MKSGVFVEYQKGLPETVVKKSKSFNQNNYLREPVTNKRVRRAAQQASTANAGDDRGYMSDEIDE